MFEELDPTADGIKKKQTEVGKVAIERGKDKNQVYK